jgi:hypothetical protein
MNATSLNISVKLAVSLSILWSEQREHVCQSGLGSSKQYREGNPDSEFPLSSIRRE